MDRGDCSPSWAPDGSYTTTTARTGDRPVLKTDFDPAGPTLGGSSDYWVGIGDVCGCGYYVHGHRVSNDGQWLVMGGLDRDANNREIYIWKIGEPESEVVRLTFETAEDQSPSLFVGQAAECQDGDGDGFGQGVDCAGPDCDDGNRDVHPGAVELCNDLDDDCDGAPDNGCVEPDAGSQDADDGGDPGDAHDAGVADDAGDAHDASDEDDVDAGHDAGVSEDAGTGADVDGQPQIEGSCGCGGRSNSGALLVVFALALIGWRWGRRAA